MYKYAMINLNTNIITGFVESEIAADPEYEPELILVDSIDETWINRKRWVAATQTWVDVLPNEVNYDQVQNSAMMAHFDSDGEKRWLNTYVNDIAADVASLNFSVDANGILSIG